MLVARDERRALKEGLDAGAGASNITTVGNAEIQRASKLSSIPAQMMPDGRHLRNARHSLTVALPVDQPHLPWGVQRTYWKTPASLSR
jgi:hypothetical protein